MAKLRTKQDKRKSAPSVNTALEWIMHCDAIGLPCYHNPDLGVMYVKFPGMYVYAFQDEAGQPVMRVFESLNASVHFSNEVPECPTPTKSVIITYRFMLGTDIRFDTLDVGNLDYHRLAWAVNSASYGNNFGGVSLPEISTEPDNEQDLYVRVVLPKNFATPAELNSLIGQWSGWAVGLLKYTADLYFNDQAWADYTKTILGAGFTAAPRRTPALSI
jgi:hypothetical protein